MARTPNGTAGEVRAETKDGARNTIGEPAIYKVRLQGQHGVAIGLPKDVCLALGMAPGQSFVAVRAVGPCLVITRATDVSSAESQVAEADAELAAAIMAWESGKDGRK